MLVTNACPQFGNVRGLAVPSSSSARLKGDDFQHLYTWYRVLSLRKHGQRTARVSIEVPGVGALDDVASHSVDHDGTFSQFCQVKFHVDHGKQYSTDLLLQERPGESSLLKKLYNGWQRVARECARHEVVLLTNRSWDSADPFAGMIDGATAAIKEEFLVASARTNVGKVRERWLAHLGADSEEFGQFIRALHIDFGYSSTKKLIDDVTERMGSIGLRCDEEALAAGVQQVRDWIKAGQVDIADTEFQAAIDRFQLAAGQPEPFALIHLHTIVHRAFSAPADYVLDWVDLFPGSDDRGRLPTDPAAWNTIMLPAMLQLRKTIDAVPDLRLLRWRGQSRLSAWLAAGFAFRQVAGYTLEARQGPYLWRTDTPPAPDFKLAVPDLHELGTGMKVAVGVSVTGDLTEDVLDYLSNRCDEYGAVLFLRPGESLGPTCFRGAADVTAFAQQAKAAIQRFVRKRRAQQLGLFYFGPLSGALFLGHQLNACAQEIQVFEDANSGYAPSFLLHE